MDLNWWVYISSIMNIYIQHDRHIYTAWWPYIPATDS